jgi:hypothetical protein
MADWQAYDQLEPLGVSADRYLLASLLAVSINTNLDPAKHQPVSAEDFMPGLAHHQPPDPEADAMRIKSMFMAMAQPQRGDA